MNYWITFIVSCLIAFVKQTESSGLFELRLNSFRNEHGKDSLGGCCAQTDRQGSCVGACKTRFRICLKHYQAKIDLTSPCTFGDVVTPVLGENTFNLTKSPYSQANSDSVNLIRFPFEFAWPGTFTLIVEALHDTNDTKTREPGVLISRIPIQRVLDVSANWTQDLHQAKHSNIEFEFRVTCDPNYYGQGCSKLCRSRNDQFGHYTCSANGSVICLQGWQGDYCTTPRCLQGCHEQHGHCTKPNECMCSTGWKGKHCDECEAYPGCIHGTCTKPWECKCLEGWGGLFCNQDLNYCTNHQPCHNGGTCFNTGQGSYTCKCAPGFTGTDCEVKVSDCVVNPCLNSGVCTDDLQAQSYQCTCNSGWTGRHCEKEIITCATKPCLHGQCRDSAQGFKCECPAGYSGINCELQADDCRPNPCANSGKCTTSGDQVQCQCPAGFKGTRCEINIDDCQTNPCVNGGSCVDMVNQFRCQCIPGFIGAYCENKVDLCLTKPCANGGTCRNLNNDYACTCRPGFTGKDCSVDVDECQSAPCKNGGTCVNRVNSFQCVCAGGFRGSTCEEEAFATGWDLGGSLSRHIANHEAQSGRSETLTGAQIALIAILSIAVPVIAIFAIAVVICLKRKRKRAQEKDDAEARKQNEQNASHHSMHQQHQHNSMVGVKRNSNSALALDQSHHMIKNTWDKSSVNAALSNSLSMDDSCLLNQSLYGNYSDQNQSVNQQECFQVQPQALQTLQRAKSQKQLNTDPVVMHRASQILHQHQQGGKELLGLDKRISVLSEQQLCNQRWSVQQVANRLAGPCSPPHM